MAFIKIFKEKNVSELNTPSDMDSWHLHNEFAMHGNLRVMTYTMIIFIVGVFTGSFFFFPDVLFDKFRQFNAHWHVLSLPISMMLYIVLHELVHALFMPSNKVGEGQRYCLVSNGMPAVFYNGPMSITRYIIMALSPLVILSMGLGVAMYFYDDVLLEFLLLNHVLACLMDVKIAFRSLRYKKSYEECFSSGEGILFR